MRNKIRIKYSLWEILLKICFFFLPLLGVNFLRLSIVNNNIPIFFILLLVIGTIYLISILKLKGKILFEKATTDILFLLMIFVFIHLLNSFRINNWELSVVEVIKGIISIVIFFFIILIFDNKKYRNFEFLKGAFLSSTIILIFLIYKYRMVFHSSYLGINLDFKTEAGKNQLAFYISIIFPMILANLINKKTLLSFGIFVIHLFALIYVDSKTAILCVTISILFVYINTRRSVIKNSIYILSIGALILLFLFISGIILIKGDFIISAINYYVKEIDLEIAHSSEMRMSLILKSLVFFIHNPIFGIGTSSFFEKIGLLTHNSYLQILCEQGLVGISIFIVIIQRVVSQISIKNKNNDLYNMALTSSVIIVFLYLVFINAYFSPIIYVVLGLFLRSKNSKVNSENKK